MSSIIPLFPNSDLSPKAQPKFSALSKHWGLDNDITFLNHGSFGACPIPVIKKQRELQDQMESEPVRFMIRELEQLWDAARAATAKFLGTDSKDLVFVKNTTMGVNTVFHSLRWNRGDEVLITDHTYGACLNTIRYYAELNGYVIKVVKVPFPMKNEQEMIMALDSGITSKTKLLFIDHITSASGTVFPVEKIVPHFKEKGIDVFVDGAHAPGMLDLNIDALGADYYVGNCHKWICSPKGSAILYVHPAKQKNIGPLQVSHIYDRSTDWAKQFFWPATDDYTNYLSVPEAIKFMGSLFPEGWKALREHNRGLILHARKIISRIFDFPLPVPDSMTGSIGNICLGKAELPSYGFNFIHPVQDMLYNKYKIEVPIIIFPRENPMLWVRPAAQAYNDISQYEYLAQALKEIIKR